MTAVAFLRNRLPSLADASRSSLRCRNSRRSSPAAKRSHSHSFARAGLGRLTDTRIAAFSFLPANRQQPVALTGKTKIFLSRMPHFSVRPAVAGSRLPRGLASRGPNLDAEFP